MNKNVQVSSAESNKNEQNISIALWEDPVTCRHRNWPQANSKRDRTSLYRSLSTVRLVCPMKGCLSSFTSPTDGLIRVEVQFSRHWSSAHPNSPVPRFHQQLGLYRCLNCGHLINDDEQYPNSQLPSPISRTRAYYHKHHCKMAPRDHPCPVSGCSVTPFVDAWTLKTHLRVVHRKMRYRCRWPMKSSQESSDQFCTHTANFRSSMKRHIMKVHFGERKGIDWSLVAEEDRRLLAIYVEELQV